MTPLPKALTDYIADCRASKLSEEQIRELVVQAGWEKELITQALPITPSAKSTPQPKKPHHIKPRLLLATGIGVVLALALAGGGYYFFTHRSSTNQAATSSSPTPNATPTISPRNLTVTISPEGPYTRGQSVTVTASEETNPGLKGLVVIGSGVHELQDNAPFAVTFTIPSDASESYQIGILGKYADTIQLEQDAATLTKNLPISE